jgi:hypothetical protein
MSLMTLPRDRRGEHTFVSVSGRIGDLPAGRLTHSHRQVLRYWDERRAGEIAPCRATIDPVDLRTALPNLALWDVTEDGGYRCRLAGTEIDTTLGRSLQGVRLGDIPCTCRDDVAREFDSVRLDGCVTYAERTLGWAGKPHLYYRHLLMPLRNRSSAIGLLLGVLTFHNVSDRPVEA